MILRVHNRSWVVIFWILALIFTASAQTPRRQSKIIPKKVTQTDTSETDKGPNEITFRQSAPKGWVWVTQTIDLARQLGGEENIMTLDGEPLPSMLRKRVTLGLVLDDEGHIVTRLIDVMPGNPPIDITARALGHIPTPVKFLGMDTVTGLCVLKANDPNLTLANFSGYSSPRGLPNRLNIRLFGVHPNQTLSLGSRLVAQGPRISFYNGQISKATSDFRYSASNPIYHLISPQLTAVQDCSLIFDRENSVFGLAIYDTGSQGPHLVYPIKQVSKIANAVIQSNHSLAHGWLGTAGTDATMRIPTGTEKSLNRDLGVQVTAVAPDSPAELAGVQPRDILLSVNERRVETLAHMASIIQRLPARSEITLKVRRGDEYKSLKAKLVPAPATDPEQQLMVFNQQLETMEVELSRTSPTDPRRQRLESRVGMMRDFVGAVTNPAPPEIRLRVFYGFEVQTLTGQLMKYFAVTNGLLVSNVIENNKAARSGLRTGDVILKVGDLPINNLASLIQALDKSSSNSPVMTISRNRDQVKINFQR
jgi:serine protease Do